MFLVTVCFISCGNKKSLDGSSIIEFDINKKYPSKTISLQDIADVEYIILESKDDYLYTEFEYISENYIIARNQYDREFLFFDKKGRAVTKFSKYGSGPEEYTLAVWTVYCEEDDDLYIFTYFNGIKVYSQKGVYKRQLNIRKDAQLQFMYDYDKNYLLFYDYKDSHPNSFFLVPKGNGGNGEIINIPISYPKKIEASIYITFENGAGTSAGFDPGFAIKNGPNVLLNDISNDTIFSCTPDKQLIPVFTRKPSNHKIESPVMVHAYIETSFYYFFATQKLEFDFENMAGLEKKGYFIDKKSNQIFQANIMNPDYSGQNLAIYPYLAGKSSDSNVGVIPIETSELLKANNNGKLKGRLKDAFDSMDEKDPEPFILMIMKFKY
jgi:hypothetical protein